MRKLSESLWSEIQDRSCGKTVRKEDDISLLDNEGLYDYIKSKYESRIPNFNVDMGYYTNKSSNEKHLLIQPYGRWKPLMLYVFYNDGKIGEICTHFDKFKRWNFNILKQKYLLIPDRHYDECNYNFKISEKDGTITNHTVIGIIDILVEDKSKILLESIWSDMQDRSAGETVRKEDMITTNEDLRNKIQELYKEQGEGETLDVSSLTKLIKCDDFSNIFNRFREVKHIIGIEDWDVSNVKNMSKMFSGCTYFNSDLSKWDVSSVGDMKCMFMGCEKFNCDLSKWDVSNVGDMDAMFWGCNKFNSDLSKWNVSSVGDMDSMFWNCQTFNSDLSKWNVSSVEYMGNMFDGCKNFYSDLSKWNVSKVMSMQYMFQDCENFNSDLSKWDVSNVGNMECMFDGCKSLKKIPSWYRNEGLNESIWSDMQDRSTGDAIRKEDEKQHLFDTLTKLYPPIDSTDKIEFYDHSIVVPLFKCLNTYSNLVIYDDRKFVEFSTINPSGYRGSKYKKLYPIFLNLWKELDDNFTFVDSYDYNGFDHWHTIKYKPKDRGLVDEKFCVSIINHIIDFIDDTKDIIKIINNSNDSRF